MKGVAAEGLVDRCPFVGTYLLKAGSMSDLP
jgi:hypothetical protein